MELIDSKNRQADMIKRNIEEYQKLKNLQRDLEEEIYNFNRFMDYVKNLDKQSDRYESLELRLRLDNFHYEGADVNYWAEACCKGWGAANNKDVEIETIKAVLDASLNVYEKHLNKVNDKIINFNFLKGDNKNV